MTLGSICDGIGGWQLAAVRAGIKPVWSSEIDPHCMQVTARHFPNTIQLGDVTNLKWQASYVDIITAGTPCQSLSVAGKREGLKGESGLFFSAIKLVRRINPKFFVWENVPGAFSSNAGNDFRTVLEEILQERVPLPRYWSNAGLVDGRRCQVAWRLLDAQYWGVPQRRKRIFLVADFAGRRAGKILFEREGVSGNIAAGEGKERHTAAQAQSDTGCAIGFGAWASTPSVDVELAPSQRTRNAIGVAIYEHHWKDARVKNVGDKAPTVSAMYGTGGLNTPLVSYGLKLNSTCDNAREQQPTLRTAPFACVAYGLRQNVTSDYARELQPTLNAKPRDMVAAGVVRRLTPLECERLQGLPDDWTAGISETQRYKAIGNGMAQPIADWILRRIKDVVA